jgi:preprotein translocase subunit SecF
MSSKDRFILLLTMVLVIVAAYVVVKVPFTWGLDVTGGKRIVLQARTADLCDERGKPLSPEDVYWKMQVARNALSDRIRNDHHVRNGNTARIFRAGRDRIVVEIPDPDFKL